MSVLCPAPRPLTTPPLFPRLFDSEVLLGLMLGKNSRLQIVPRPPVQENVRIISRSSAGATEPGDSPGTRLPGPRLNPRCVPYYAYTFICAVILTRDVSDPRLIFEATAWTALTILITHLSVSLYWDFRAAFQEYVEGRSAVNLVEHVSLTAIPQESIARLTHARSRST